MGQLDGLDRIWLHITQMSQFRSNPLIVESGDGIWLNTSDGRRLLDGTSAAMVTSLGYSNTPVQEAIVKQIKKLPFWPLLHGTSDAALRLVEDLNQVLPGDLGHVFLLSGGSEATETALKMARQYQVICGRPRKTKVIARYGAYHGATKGSLSVSGLKDKAPFAPLMPDVIHVHPPYAYRPPHPNFDSLSLIEATIQAEGRDTIAAVIVDPIMAAAGMIVPPQDYYQSLARICGDDILLIFDEVLTGFGRTGNWFAADHYEVTPDIICLGKGISSGYAPLAATVARPHVAAVFEDAGATFQHIHTAGGHPASAAAGSAVIAELQERGLIERASQLGSLMLARLADLGDDVEAIGDVRGMGMLAGIELVRDRETRTPFDRPLAPLVVQHALEEEQLLVRCSRNVVQVAPPLICSEADIDEILSRLKRSLIAVTKKHNSEVAR